jgi:hypothetical protein
MSTFEVFREEGQVTLVCLAGQWPQTLFDAQIGKVLAHDIVPALAGTAGMVAGGHRLDYLLPALCIHAGRPLQESREAAVPLPWVQNCPISPTIEKGLVPRRSANRFDQQQFQH